LSNKISNSRLPFNNLETAIISVGKKDISKNEIIKVMFPEVDFAEAKIIKKSADKKSVHFEIGDGFTHRLANCCKPTEKDEIIGYITLQKIITVHKKNCRGPELLTGSEYLRPAGGNCIFSDTLVDLMCYGR
jgi:(p)ppGpp synthase/HD superfamily hydrolase